MSDTSVLLASTCHNSLANVTLYSQVLAPDVTQAGLPIAFADGRMSTTPPTSGGPAPAGIKRTYSLTSSSAATGSAPTVSAMVT